MKACFFIILCSFLFSCQGSIYLHKTMWRFENEKSLSEMKTFVRPKINGYYNLLDKSFFVPGIMIFYENGYFSAWGTKKEWMFIRNEQSLGPNVIGYWGRYEITGDSVVIQYFIDTGVSGAFIFPRHDYTVKETRGKFINDSTVAVFSIAFNNYSETLHNKKGINHHDFEKPLVYKFIPCDSLPPSDNWIKHLDYSKSKLDSRWLFW